MRTQRDSTSIVLTDDTGNVLLQLRDDIPGIEYPGHYGLISGWVEAGEDPLVAIRRELREELKDATGNEVLFGAIRFLGSDERSDRPWTEYIFHACLLTPVEDLRIYEGRKFDFFTFEACKDLTKFAPHHKQYLDRYRPQIEVSVNFCRGRIDDEKEAAGMNATQKTKAIEEYIEVSQLGRVKDYEALERGDGFVVSTTSCPTAAIHTHAEARFIALLEFKHDVPRGNHYHLRKVEHMIVLSGRLLCSFALPQNPKNTVDRILEAGQMVRILPGRVHTYTALDGDVSALEYAPQRYEASDVIVIE